MLYDEHRKLGFEHAKMGTKRHKWGDPHLQAAYDEGYNIRNQLEDELEEYQRARQSMPGMPGQAAIVITCRRCNYSWRQSSAAKARCSNCGYVNIIP